MWQDFAAHRLYLVSPDSVSCLGSSLQALLDLNDVNSGVICMLHGILILPLSHLSARMLNGSSSRTSRDGTLLTALSCKHP